MAKAEPETRKRRFGQLATNSCVGGTEHPVCFAESVKVRAVVNLKKVFVPQPLIPKFS